MPVLMRKLLFEGKTFTYIVLFKDMASYYFQAVTDDDFQLRETACPKMCQPCSRPGPRGLPGDGKFSLTRSPSSLSIPARQWRGASLQKSNTDLANYLGGRTFLYYPQYSLEERFGHARPFIDDDTLSEKKSITAFALRRLCSTMCFVTSLLKRLQFGDKAWTASITL